MTNYVKTEKICLKCNKSFKVTSSKKEICRACQKAEYNKKISISDIPCLQCAKKETRGYWHKGHICSRCYDRQKVNGYCVKCEEISTSKWYKNKTICESCFKKEKSSLISNRFTSAINTAKKRKIEWTLSLEEYSAKIELNICHYCGDELPKIRVGLDRLDSNKGYTKTNTVPCCFCCNSAKGNKTLEEFESWIKRLINFRGDKNV